MTERSEHRSSSVLERVSRSECLKLLQAGGGGETAAFQEFQFEGIYSFIADERSSAVVIGGPSAELKESFRPEGSGSCSKQTAQLPEMQRIPLKTQITVAHRTEEVISNQLSFRNKRYPLDAAITAYVVCNKRWHEFRESLKNTANSTNPPAEAYAAFAYPSWDSGVESEECLKRLASFSVITTRRCLRELLRFLFPSTTRYHSPFTSDVDLVGNTLIFTSNVPAKGISMGCGHDFERKVTNAATMRTQGGKLEELTTSYVVCSFNFCQQMRVLITAEVDAIDPEFNLLPSKGASASNSSNSSADRCGKKCIYTEEMIASNPCYIHSCFELSLLEQQLVMGCPPFVELKSHAFSTSLHWGEAADQMLLGGVKMLLKGEHYRGSVTKLELFTYDCARKLSGSRANPNDKWQSLLALLQHLHKLAEQERSLRGSDVGCIQIEYDGQSDFLTIRGRSSQDVRISPDIAKWLQQKPRGTETQT